MGQFGSHRPPQDIAFAPSRSIAQAVSVSLASSTAAMVSLAESRVEDRVAKRQRKEDKQAAAVAVAAAATPSPTAATSTSVCKRSVGSITVSLASLEARSACGQTATMQQEEAKQYAADKATDKGRHLQAVALYRCKLACNKLPPTTSKLLKNQLQELWAVVGNGQPTVKPVRNMHIVDCIDSRSDYHRCSINEAAQADAAPASGAGSAHDAAVTPTAKRNPKRVRPHAQLKDSKKTRVELS
ncbi:hypothetical protein QJQ45_013111 [Haematococcus lacustris]|nr:hypothetical protein QJQ45_013111 [Haematococcus lacustris]